MDETIGEQLDGRMDKEMNGGMGGQLDGGMRLMRWIERSVHVWIEGCVDC